MSSSKLKAALLIISDTVSRDRLADKSEEILKNVFATEGDDHWTVDEIVIVPDDVARVQTNIKRLSDGDNYMNLIITTGGTGFAVKDLTPEAVYPLIHRHAPGLV